MQQAVTELKTKFNNLSVKDLLEARDLFHVHLMNKENVIGTAIGRYRVRNVDVIGGKIVRTSKRSDKRTLSNSQIVNESWPCILVFVSNWKTEEELKKGDLSQAIPPQIYMPDGRIIPLCVVEAPKQNVTDTDVAEKELTYPVSAIGGGYPLIVNSQGQQKIASTGCIVTNGNKYYALTNKHVTGTPGTTIYTKVKNSLQPIGKSTDITIGNCKFQVVYSDWLQTNLFVNVDVGLIEIDNINQWKTDIFGLGALGEMMDLNTKNITLKLIGQEVEAHGAVSGKLEGEIVALFYRYKSVGGYEYVADFFIGPRKGIDSLPTRHGDSGTLWTVKHVTENKTEEYLPIAIQWGQRAVIGNDFSVTNSFALATNLSNVCRDMDIEIVRGWNTDVDFTWGKTGHFKIGYGPHLAVSNENLKELLTVNADNLGISDADLKAGKVNKAIFTEEFVPLADVADMYWRTKRKADSSNHFADLDAKHPSVYHNKTLMELCFDKHGTIQDEWVDAEKWSDYYEKMDEADPEYDKGGRVRARLGGLPFRVWQMYSDMVAILKSDEEDTVKLEQFITAGGTMAHYIGDACQPLHISYLHDGYPDGSGSGVHSAYETNMLDMYRKKNDDNFLATITNAVEQRPVKKSELIKGGKGAAKAALSLMWETYHLIKPQEIVDAYVANSSVKNLWEQFGDKTIETIANGIHTMAVLWQSAWVEGKGDDIEAPLVRIDRRKLMKWYKDVDFVRSYKLNDPEFWEVLK